MKIILASPLYPPDIADPAPYVKELATRLSSSHQVVVLAYNHLPEKIPGVLFVIVQKHLPLFIRLVFFTFMLLKHARLADVVYIQNGPATELPLCVLRLFMRKKTVLRLGDEAALRFATKYFSLGLIQKFAIKSAYKIIVHTEESLKFCKHISPEKLVYNTERPLRKPEILPFLAYPQDAFHRYESSWEQHTQTLVSLFYATK